MYDKICGYQLDNQQQQIVLDESNHLLVVAGAGSGKTLTILGKIHYLLKYQQIQPNEILCISFTRASANSLKEKIYNEFNINMPVYTFHKLSLEILKNNHEEYDIAASDTLDNVIHQFFSIDILDYPVIIKNVLKYYHYSGFNTTKEKYLCFYKNNYAEIEILEKLISTFLHLFKCNNYSLKDFYVFLQSKNKQIFKFRYKRDKIFLSLAINIYLMYQDYLKENKEIDFDDMIIYATECVNQKGIIEQYKYIIIDEYQDTSYIRFLLIKSILDRTNAKLMVVGDDFQSIYRFTGCDISIFIDFKKYFNDAKILKIENTYRNSMELISIASTFIMRNKYQISKRLNARNHLKYPVKIIFYKNIKATFLKLVLYVYDNSHKPILILGRNNNDIFMVIDENFKLEQNGRIIYRYNKQIEIYYLTVHKSKGLEEENVIIINLEDKKLGFPNQMKDSRILNLVNGNKENYPYGEERRLFYVALTRTKNYVYLLASLIKPSIFVKELLKYNKQEIEIIKM